MSEEDKCHICSIVLTVENKTSRGKRCKPCQNILYKEYLKNKKQVFNELSLCSKCNKVLTLENSVKNRPICKECYNKKTNAYKKENKAKVVASNKEYYKEHKEQQSAYYKEHYKENKETYLNNNRKWREDNREHIRKKENERLKNDPVLQLKKNCRSRIWDALKRQGNKKLDRTVKYLDCSIDFLKEWLKLNFIDGMTIENYGSYWHIDHVIPCNKFDLTNDEDIAHCFRWTNLQPLKASENMSKHDNINNQEIKAHYKKVKKFAEKEGIELPKFNYKKYLEILI